MIGWLDCAAGASGDMLLGALVDAGVDVTVPQAAVDAVGVEPVRLSVSATTRAGLGATKVDVAVDEHPSTRTWADVRALLEGADLADAVRRTALDVFSRLAAAEGAVHRVPPDEVHFHEVGALDAVADVVGVAAGLHALGLVELRAGTVSLGSGSTRGAHGPLPVPAPAVLALLQGVPVQAGPAPYELTTPTGAALLASTVTRWGPLPPMTVSRVGVGAGGRDPAEVANVVRLVLGTPAAVASERDHPGTALLLETNVDDLDPRLWPAVLSRLLAVGASDAWLTPILMKKGRPAHTLSVLCPDEAADAVRREVFCETSTIGMRESRVAKRALQRTESIAVVDGQRIRVKLAWLDGRVVNTQPEWEDVAAAAAALGRPGKLVLQEAQAAARIASRLG
jgi:uncharacterized protein (TIGR00299 family) protein